MVRADMLRSFDFDTTHRLQNITPIRIDDFFSILSIIGRFEFTLVFVIILLIVSRKIWFGIIAFGLFGFAHIIEIIGKSILEQPGPPNMFLRTHFTDFPGLYVHTQASYPSGHSLRILFIFIVIAFYIYINKKLPTFFRLSILVISGGITFLMLYSRISLGEHWTTDVIGGTLLGISAAFGALVFF